MHAESRLTLAMLLIAAMLSLTACSADDNSDNGDSDTEQTADSDTADGAENGGDGDEEEAPVIPVEVIAVNRGDVYAAYTGAASLEAFDEAVVVAKVGGEVRQILVEEGDFVKRGDVLARLDGDQLRLELEQSRANLAKLQQEHDRNIELHERGLVASNAYETTKFDLDALQAQHDLAELRYRYTTVRAPIDGVISSRDIKVGNTIAENAPTFRITALDPLVAYLFIPEREFGRIAAAQPVQLTIDALPGVVFDGNVARISPTVDPESGTFKATIEVSDVASRLKPGMFGRFAVIYDQQSDALLLPQDAIIETQTGDMVYVVDEENVAHRVDITTGYAWREDIAVLDGLSDADRVVVVGQAALRDGSRVRVVGDPDPDESGDGEPVGSVASAGN